MAFCQVKHAIRHFSKRILRISKPIVLYRKPPPLKPTTMRLLGPDGINGRSGWGPASPFPTYCTFPTARPPAGRPTPPGPSRASSTSPTRSTGARARRPLPLASARAPQPRPPPAAGRFPSPVRNAMSHMRLGGLWHNNNNINDNNHDNDKAAGRTPGTCALGDWQVLYCMH